MGHFISRAVAAAALSSLLACEQGVPARAPQRSAAEFYDASHNAGTAGFHFLTPIVANPAGLGPSAAGVTPTVTIDQISVSPEGCAVNCTVTVLRRAVTVLQPGNGLHYHQNHQTPDGDADLDDVPGGYWDGHWDSDDFCTALWGFYRAHVTVPASGGGVFELGYADIEIVKTTDPHNKQFRKIDSSEYVALAEGKSLRINFHIEPAALFCTRPCAAVDQCHTVACDPSRAACVATNKPDGASCNDGNACTRGEACYSGVCGRGQACDANAACGASGCACNHDYSGDGFACTPHPPVAVPGAAQQVTAGTPVQLDGSASTNPNGSPLTYAWSFVSRPAGSAAALLGASTATPGFTPDLAGAYVVQLIVSDGYLSSSPQTVTITAACAISVSTSAISAAWPQASDGYPRTPLALYRGDLVALSSTPHEQNDCASGQPAFAWHWSLVAPAGSAAVLSSVSDPSPSFTIDLPGAAYVVSLFVTDPAGNASAPVTATYASTLCGANAVSLSLADTTGGSPRAFDPRIVTATASSLDDDAASCPPRFSNAPYTFAQAAASTGRSHLSVLGGASAARESLLFEPGDNAAYQLNVTATGRTGHTASATQAYQIACAAPGPVASSPTIASIASPGGGGFAQQPGVFFRDDAVTLAASADSSACFSAHNAHYVFSWSLSHSSFNNPTLAQPTFIVDQANQDYRAQVVVTDQWGRSGAASTSFTSGSCGANPLFAAVIAQPGALPGDPIALSVAPVGGRFFLTDDEDPTRCPSRFKPAYSYAWAVSSTAPFTLSSASAAAPALTARANGNFAVSVAIQAAAVATSASASVNVNCTTGPAFSVQPAAAPALPQAGDLVSVSGAVAASTCQSQGSTIQYQPSLAAPPDGTQASAGGTGGAFTFTPQTPNQSYTASIVATDAFNGLSATSAGASVQTSGCGTAAPLVQLDAAVQSLQQLNVVNGEGPQDLVLVYQPGDAHPAFTTGEWRVPIEFYLDQPVSLRARLLDPPSGGCRSYRVLSASLIKPAQSQATLFNQTSTTVPPGGSFVAAFVPDQGDLVSPFGVVPGNYALSLNVAYGLSGQTTVVSQPVHVAGRCGRNAPTGGFFINGALNQDGAAISGARGSAVVLQAQITDADTIPLAFDLGGGESTGCGLTQPLTYLWELLTPPNSQLGGVLASTSEASFVPDQSGNYDIQLQVSDGTPATADFPVTIDQAFQASAHSLSFTNLPPQAVVGQDLGSIVINDLDDNQQPVVGATVTLSIGSIGPPGGSLGGYPSATTDDNGNATFSGLALSVAGSYTLVATDGIGISNEQAITLFNPIDHLSFVFPGGVQSYAPIEGVADPDTVIVELRDGNDELVPLDNDSITLGVNGPDGAHVTTAGNVVTTGGVAQFSNLTFSPSSPPQGYALTASEAQFGAFGISDLFTVSPGAPPLQIGLAAPGGQVNGVTNRPLPGAITVQVFQETGNGPVACNDCGDTTFAVTIASGPPGGTINGGSSVSGSTANGSFVFSAANGALRLKPAGDYLLQVSAPQMTSLQAISVAVADPVLRFSIDANYAPRAPGVAPPFTVAIVDPHSGSVISINDTITVSAIVQPRSTSLAGTLTATAANGVATFDTAAQPGHGQVQLNNSGQYQLRAVNADTVHNGSLSGSSVPFFVPGP